MKKWQHLPADSSEKKRRKRNYRLVFLPCFIISLAITGYGFVTLFGHYSLVKDKAVEAHTAAQMEILEDGGFTHINGELPVAPGSSGEMVFSYDNKDFTCDAYASNEVNQDIIFSCGEAGMNLAEVKAQSN